jgi:hypothetical protein
VSLASHEGNGANSKQNRSNNGHTTCRDVTNMMQTSETVDVVVLSSTGIVRALVSAGLSVPHAEAAAQLFMPHFQLQEHAELSAFEKSRRTRSSDKRITRKRASAMLSMLDKELDRLCEHAAEEEQAQRARRGSGLALLHVLKAEYQAQNQCSHGTHRLFLSPTKRIPESEK